MIVTPQKTSHGRRFINTFGLLCLSRYKPLALEGMPIRSLGRWHNHTTHQELFPGGMEGVRVNALDPCKPRLVNIGMFPPEVKGPAKLRKRRAGLLYREACTANSRVYRLLTFDF